MIYFHSGMIPFSFCWSHSGDLARENDSSLIPECFNSMLGLSYFHSAGISLNRKLFQSHSGMIYSHSGENHSGHLARKMILVSFWNDSFPFWNDSISILRNPCCRASKWFPFYSHSRMIYFHSRLIPFPFSTDLFPF